MDIREYYQLIRHCGCESGLVASWCKDERGVDVKACDRCKPDLLYRIFNAKYADFFDEWAGKILFDDPPPVDFEWRWEDFLKERGCEQVIGLEAAKRKSTEGQMMIPCPNGDAINMDTEDKSVHILVPKDYADQVLKNGEM